LCLTPKSDLLTHSASNLSKDPTANSSFLDPAMLRSNSFIFLANLLANG